MRKIIEFYFRSFIEKRDYGLRMLELVEIRFKCKDNI